MIVRWAPRAAADLEQAFNQIHKDNPRRAPEIVQEIFDRIEGLLRFPRLGRVSSKRGFRELVIAGLPYVVLYRLRGETVQVTRVVHGAQDWARKR